MFVPTLGKASTAKAVARPGAFPRLRLAGLEGAGTVRRNAAVARRVRLSGLGKAATRSAVPSVIRSRVRLGDVYCNPDPVTGSRVCYSGTPPTQAPQYPDGMLIKGSGPEVDMMQGGVRRWIPDPATFACMGLSWGNVQTIPDATFAAIPAGPAFPVQSCTAPPYTSLPLIVPAPQVAAPGVAVNPQTGYPYGTPGYPGTIQPATQYAGPSNYVSSPSYTPPTGSAVPWGQYALYGGIAIGGLVILKMFGVIGKK